MDKKTNLKTQRFARLRDRLTGFVGGYVKMPGATEAERRAELKKRLMTLAKGVGQALAAALMTRTALPFNVDLFGAALLCAADRFTPYVYVGLAVSSIFSASPAAYFLMYTLGLGMRSALSLAPFEPEKRRLYREGMGLRVMTAVTMAFMIGLCRSVSGGFLYYDLFGFALGTAAPAATLVFRTALDRDRAAGSLRDTCLLLLCSVGIASLSGLEFAGFSLAAVAAFMLTLYVSRECGMLRGSVAGLFGGLALGLEFAPIFALAGLISGLFWRISTAAATLSAIAVAFFISAWTGSALSFTALAPDLLAATLIFAPLSHLGLLPKIPLYSRTSPTDPASAKSGLERQSHKGAIERFEAMQAAFGDLSGLFYRMSESVGRPDSRELFELTERTFCSYCDNCARHSLCWDGNCSDTSDTVALLARTLAKEGRVLVSDIPEHTARRCFRSGQITDAINSAYSARVERALKENKTELFAEDYRAVSELIGQALRANAEEHEQDTALTRKLRASAGLLDLPVRSLTAYGGRKKHILAANVDLARVKAGAEDVRRAFEKVCGFPLTPPEFSVEHGSVGMSLSSARRFSAEYAGSGGSKQGESQSGDSLHFFENRADYFYALLSDGMGSGRDAALTSRLSAVFLSKMLKAGNTKATALEMLNTIVRNKGLECFATVDLLEIDLISGQACFVKSGAAPSYVLRSGSLFRIEADNCPIGITRELQSEQISFTLMDGDVVVLLSDGVACDLEEALWVADMLTEWQGDGNLGGICKKIVDEAKRRNGGRDDVSAAMIKIQSRQ